MIVFLQLKRLAVSQKRLSQQGKDSIICSFLHLYYLQQLNRRPLNVCGVTGILKSINMLRQPLCHVIYKVIVHFVCVCVSSWRSLQRISEGKLCEKSGSTNSCVKTTVVALMGFSLSFSLNPNSTPELWCVALKLIFYLYFLVGIIRPS